jgi:adenine-specific DNA-methyltransferase
MVRSTDPADRRDPRRSCWLGIGSFVAKKTAKTEKKVEALRHSDDKRVNIPTAEHQSVLEAQHLARKEVRYPRNTDLDPQLVWRGKDYQDWTDLVVQAPPLYIQEKVHPKALIDDLRRESKGVPQDSAQIDLFADFNGVAEGADRTDFYQHDQSWTNRMILGDSLQVMASLAEREGLRASVQSIYIDPPYGIRFNSNFQWSTTSRDVKDGNTAHITREPEQVKAFRDTWRDGINSYLTYLRDRLVVARDLLAESGSIFVQIGEENVHRVRVLLDEVFGDSNEVAQITVRVKSPLGVSDLARTADFVLWYAKSKPVMKFRQLRMPKLLETHPEFSLALLPDGTVQTAAKARDAGGARYFTAQNLGSSGYTQSCMYTAKLHGRSFEFPKGKSWKTHADGMRRLLAAGRLHPLTTSLRWRYFFDDAPSEAITDIWSDTFGESQKTYVVQTSEVVIKRCLLMTTDPGDLVIDPTCGSGTTAYVAEEWGRRWITVDTSRVALALARARLMGARYPYYLLADSSCGLRKEAEISTRPFIDRSTHANVRHGFVYQRVPHVTLKSIANNTEIDVIYEEHEPRVRAALDRLNEALRGCRTPFRVTAGGREGKPVVFDGISGATFTMPTGEVVSASALLEWEVPHEPAPEWPEAAKKPLSEFWQARDARQQAIDGSIAAKAEIEFLYDRPYVDPKTVRVAGPFTVESLSPHRMLSVDHEGELIDPLAVGETTPPYGRTFEGMVIDNLRAAGVQQPQKADRITFTSVTPWPGEMVCAEGRFRDRDTAKDIRAAIFIGPEFGTVSRPDLVQAAREAGDAGFDVLIACAFNYEAHASEFCKLGRIPVLKARMNADLHMSSELKSTGKGNLFVVFGEPDIEILHGDDGTIRVHVKGVDVFDPTTGEVRSDSADGIACWFIDTDYNEESFFVRHAYFLGQNDPYGALKATLKAEIDPDVWATLNSPVSRPFSVPQSGRIAVKVINHLGDEVMKIIRVREAGASQ